MRRAALLVALSLAPALLGQPPAGFKDLFNGKDTAGWAIRSPKVNVTLYHDEDGKLIAGGKLTKVDQKDVIVDAQGTALNGVSLVERDGKKVYVDLQGKVVPGAKAAKIGGRDVVVDPAGKRYEKFKATTEQRDNPSGWTVVDGVLVCSQPKGGNDLVTVEKFADFELHVEFLASSNSGVYLQGRYEIQVNNDFGRKPTVVEKDGVKAEVWDKHQCGAIYGKVAPSKNMAKKPDEWQSFDVVFRAARPAADGKPATKARATVVWNGEKVIDDAEIDGPTGGALDGKVFEPGPILLQGDHGKVSFRNVRIKPLPAGK